MINCWQKIWKLGCRSITLDAKKSLFEKKMIKHIIGSHILIDNLEDVFRFCDNSGCPIGIAQGLGRCKTTFKRTSSDCEYRVKLSLKGAEKSTKTSPCTNRHVICSLSNVNVSSYNMLRHMKKTKTYLIRTNFRAY